MLSLEEIKEWADTIEAQSTLNLIKFCNNPARPAHRVVTEIVFADGLTNTWFGFSANSTSSTWMPPTKE
jgi:hypothetical protein